jgi:hypothetical protein
MSICPVCKKRVRGADKVKVKGVWQHHHSPVKKKVKIVLKPRSLGMSTMVKTLYEKSLTDEQLLRKALEKKSEPR